MRIIYLSPHLDDAVLSAGGLIPSQVRSGVRVEVWTCMAGAPADPHVPEFAQIMHRIWGFSDAAEALQKRRLEDLRAVEGLGARPLHFDFLDCIYRRGRGGEALYSDITLPIQPDDAELPDRIAHAVQSRLQDDDQLVCQLAIGGHVDHVIVRRAAESLHRPLIYMADIPYVLDHPDELAPSITGLAVEHRLIGEADYRGWIEAIDCYASQVPSVFGSRQAMLERMRQFWEERRGIDLWRLPDVK